MNPQILESLTLVCPACRSPENISPLQVGSRLQEYVGYLIEGFLDCSHPACGRRYPVSRQSRWPGVYRLERFHRTSLAAEYREPRRPDPSLERPAETHRLRFYREKLASQG